MPLYEMARKTEAGGGCGRKIAQLRSFFYLSRLITRFWSNFARFRGARQAETPATPATRLVVFIRVIEKHVVRRDSN